MIKVSVLYENSEGKSFDMGYYLSKHIPMVKQTLGSACKHVYVDQGLGGAQPGSRPAYLAMGHMLFDSVDAFQKSFGPHADSLLGDIPKFTSVQPVIQISEVKM